MQNIKEYYKEKKEYYKNYIEDNNLAISMVIVWVGNNKASEKYVKHKINVCNEVGIQTRLDKYPEDVDPDLFYCKLRELNSEDITGYIVQFPLPKQLDEEFVKTLIDPNKDIDGFNVLSKTRPATPLGIITYLEDQKYDFVDKNVVVIGRGKLCSRPIVDMFIDRRSNVSIINSKTSKENKASALINADLIVSATGCRNTLTDNDLQYQCLQEIGDSYPGFKDWIVHENCFIFDVGISFNEDGKQVGDCENVTVVEKTPNIGGCGLLTRLAVIENLIKLAE